ncbi:unnamed protein product [Vitrella brassicaformis CCMP3155]|uniref:Uncharacterized protein n=1 Tax=Vitrella brassicaformis (strain CCMP3155) TaxID=1169540 RepID=A0A0G4ESP5_VITBC|nr:unnamed protein product [Vitrella brassicaformis CCMP3155]|eukprot:CEM01040.1 unnamed protein product [Vitrella brassicaformis CCMP3155]
MDNTNQDDPVDPSNHPSNHPSGTTGSPPGSNEPSSAASMKMTEPETESNDVAQTFPTISLIMTVRLSQIEGDSSSPVIEPSDHWSAESVWSDKEVDVTVTEQPEYDRGKVGGPAEYPSDCNLPALPRERGDWQLMPTQRTFRERVERFFSVFIARDPPSERRGRSRDAVMMEEAGLPRGVREQELAIAAVEREFHDAAGYNAAYQEFETRLRYEEAEGPDGLMVDVLVPPKAAQPHCVALSPRHFPSSGCCDRHRCRVGGAVYALLAFL